MAKRFLIYPGMIKSKQDDDVHFISARRLIWLYGIRHTECLIADDQFRVMMDPKHDWNQYIHLGPRYDGDYKEFLDTKMREKGWKV